MVGVPNFSGFVDMKILLIRQPSLVLDGVVDHLLRWSIIVIPAILG